MTKAKHNQMSTNSGIIVVLNKTKFKVWVFTLDMGIALHVKRTPSHKIYSEIVLKIKFAIKCNKTVL